MVGLGVKLVVDLLGDLGEILLDIFVAILELLFGVFGDLALDHALFILEKAVGSTEEAVEGDNFLEETEF